MMRRYPTNPLFIGKSFDPNDEYWDRLGALLILRKEKEQAAALSEHKPSK